MTKWVPGEVGDKSFSLVAKQLEHYFLNFLLVINTFKNKEIDKPT